VSYCQKYTLTDCFFGDFAFAHWVYGNLHFDCVFCAWELKDQRNKKQQGSVKLLSNLNNDTFVFTTNWIPLYFVNHSDPRFVRDVEDLQEMFLICDEWNGILN